MVVFAGADGAFQLTVHETELDPVPGYVWDGSCSQYCLPPELVITELGSFEPATKSPAF